MALQAEKMTPYSPGTHSNRIVPLLVNFLKQYHLNDLDDAVREMLRDVSLGGKSPRALGNYGYLSSSDVREAIAAFEVWKEVDGRVSMPAFYRSQTHNISMQCCVLRRNNDGTLDLGTQPVDTDQNTSTLVKKRADPNLVRPRNADDWFVPPFPSRQIWTVLYPFNGAEYGPEYLVLSPGSEIERVCEDQGWAYGHLCSEGKSGGEIAEGWYPADFAVPAGSTPPRMA